MDDEKRALFRELDLLRYDLRCCVAAFNADTHKWFGGSAGLQESTGMALLDGLLMGVRRQLDQPLLPSGTVEPGLASLTAHLARAGREDLVSRLRDRPEYHHIKRHADKRIAHAKPADLEARSRQFRGLIVGEVHIGMVAKIVGAMSDSFREGLWPSIRFDITGNAADPWDQAVRSRGLPVVDWKSVFVFRDPNDLHPDLRPDHALAGEPPLP